MTAQFRRKLALFGIGFSLFGLLLDLLFWHDPTTSILLLMLNVCLLIIANQDLQLNQIRAIFVDTDSEAEEKT